MGSKQLYKERMAPGSSSMLRARRRDVNVKPNRVLDRNSSRGMIYENEELRLRTININAEVERGQNDIKKLRRENEHLRREIWALREEYDRLETLLKSRELASEEAEESEDDEEESDGKDEADQENASNQQKVAKDSDMLSVVEEEPEGNSTEGEEIPQQNPQQPSLISFYREDGLPTKLMPMPISFIHSENTGETPLNTGEGVPIPPNVPGFQSNMPGFEHPLASPYQQVTEPRIYQPDLDQILRNSCPIPSINETSASMPPDTEAEIQQVPLPPPPPPPPISSLLQEQRRPCSIPSNENVNSVSRPINNELRCEPYAGQLPTFLRLNCVQPHTLYFQVTNTAFNYLTVQEVIDSMSEQLSSDLLTSLKGVRLVGGACYLSLTSDNDVKEMIRTPLKLRDIPLQLEDASAGAMFIALSGVPHDVSDESVANTLAHFGTVIGGVERRLYRGVDTGERLTRLRPRLAIPRAIWLGGCKVCLRVMRPEEVSALSLARRKSFRSHIHVRLRPVPEDGVAQPPPPIPPLPVTTTTTSVTQSVPNLAPLISESAPPSIGFSCTQSVPDLTTRPPPNDPPPKPQFFSSSSSASNVFLFPTPCTDPTKRLSAVNPPTPQLPNTATQPQTSVATPPGRSQSTPPTLQPQSSPVPSRRQLSQSDPETPKPPSPSPSKLQRHRSRKTSKTNSPGEGRKANGDASSSSGQDSPTKPGRRRMSVYFKRNGSIRRTTSVDQSDGVAGDLTTCSERERSNSDVSSRTSGGFRRKMSSTGRENGKVPWCGCWGNGCV
ncbi:uncharacterized protein LOC142328951 isoform X2 [Lycorma delicatula]|uniref:uncharacterized protein LOC142328951 isoform X2 n=1 Tax=Lycorma delicatula TaxID=130591 RepID=UPI003F50E2A8